jgi:hypothetical protein
LGVSFAHAFAAIVPSVGSSAVIVFRAINGCHLEAGANPFNKKSALPRPDMSRSSSSVLVENSVSLSTTSSICDSRMIFISCPRLYPGLSTAKK